MKTKPIQQKKVSIITLGCWKNLVDSEVLLAQLQANHIPAQHENTSRHQQIIIINTCGFIDRAKEESINTILYFAEKKKRGTIDKLYVTGCLSQRYKTILEAEIPEVDAFFGTNELPALLKKLNATYQHELLGERALATPSHYAYLKISEGCNRTCTFCAIPLMRGKHISRPMEDIITEAKNLVNAGVKEIMLIAQELTYYGLDIYKKRKLDELLRRLSDIEGLEWIRLHYAYPAQFPLEILKVMREKSNICKYLDLPLQHASDKILRAMKRQITQQDTITLLNTIRDKVPDITLRTTMIVGFPGETPHDFEELLAFVDQQRFDRLGVFQYSHEEDTSAYAAYDDDVPEEVKEFRAAELMRLQEKISLKLNQQKVGKTFRVLIDRKENGHFIGRTEADSPEIDNEVFISANSKQIAIGSFALVRITEATEFDLYGEITD